MDALVFTPACANMFSSGSYRPCCRKDCKFQGNYVNRTDCYTCGNHLAGPIIQVPPVRHVRQNCWTQSNAKVGNAGGDGGSAKGKGGQGGKGAKGDGSKSGGKAGGGGLGKGREAKPAGVMQPSALLKLYASSAPTSPTLSGSLASRPKSKKSRRTKSCCRGDSKSRARKSMIRNVSL